MNENTVFELTKTMESFIDAHEKELDIMRELLMVAEGVHANEHCNHFRIGDHVYTLEELVRIQEEAEHEAFVPKHRESMGR